MQQKAAKEKPSLSEIDDVIGRSFDIKKVIPPLIE